MLILILLLGALTYGDVIPTLDCISTNPDGTVVAYFGYENTGPLVTIPISSDNMIVTGAEDQGQVLSFLFFFYNS